MGMDWYDSIAKRNGGYRSNALFTIEGLFGEDVFQEKLVKMLGTSQSVLDAGCGDGEFTLRAAKHARNIIGFDNSRELLRIAEANLRESKLQNVSFIYAWTHEHLPFEDGQFDLIYVRRGPTSILYHSRILKSGGTIFGIHSGALEQVKARLEENDFTNIEIEEFDDAIMYFPNVIEFTKQISAIPGNPDYSLPEYKEELQAKLNENRINGRLALKQWRYIWKANKK